MNVEIKYENDESLSPLTEDLEKIIDIKELESPIQEHLELKKPQNSYEFEIEGIKLKFPF